jgi:hypothetical protein
MSWYLENQKQRRRDYEQYLHSPHWLKRRQARLDRASRQCEFQSEESPAWLGPRCTETTGLQVHHLHYDTLGRERDDDLEVLCPLHHLTRHIESIACE